MIQPQRTSPESKPENIDLFIDQQSHTPKQKLQKFEPKNEDIDKIAILSLLKCKVCEKQGKDVPAKYVNVGKFKIYRYVCEIHAKYETQLIPFDYQPGQYTNTFIQNLIINNNSDPKFKMLLDSNFKENVMEIMDRYHKQWKQSFMMLKKTVKLHYTSIMNTFDTRCISRFLQNIADKSYDQSYEDQLCFYAQSLSVSGQKPYNQLDQISRSLIKSYEDLKKIFQEELKKIKQRTHFIKSFLEKKSLDKITSRNNSQSQFVNSYVVDDTENNDEEVPFIKKKQEETLGTQNQNGKSQFQKSQLIEIQVNIKNFKDVFTSIQSKKQLVSKVIIKHQTPQIVQKTLLGLGMCVNLQQIQIEDPLLATKQIIFFIISTFSKLRRLSFNCYNDFDDQCAQKILNLLPNLERCYWGCNFYKCVGKMAELRAWREHPKRKRKTSLKNQTLLRMIRQMKNLQNIWISDLQSPSTPQILSQLKHMPNLKHLALGQFNLTMQQSIIHDSLWQQIFKAPSLQSIALIQIKLTDYQFTNFLINHKLTLRTLVINNCQGLTDEAFKFLKNNQFKLLRQLYLIKLGSRQLIGEFIWDLVQLETLVMRHCEFYQIVAADKVCKMKSLINLDLNGCHWVSDIFMSSVSKLSKTLEYLNLNHTNITFHTREHILRLQKLRALDIGGTNINQKDVGQICNKNRELQKLGLSGLSGSSVIIGRGVITKGKIHLIATILKNLTHLDVSACDRLDDNSLERFNKLQFVNIWNVGGISQKTKQGLRQAGMVVFDKA